ncbi:MAG: isoleucine--tRNA ligase, partial [Actinomycetota bacterium]|nr:isoleucine--tRNA ligase [Actinomycetota bacterium]
MPFGPVDSQADFVALEHKVLERWREADLLEQVKASRKGASPWVFYEGPPTANARPGLHHVWPRAFKDLWMRFQTMRGHDVPRKGGWDCHGLPVEIEVEKELGLRSKHEIEAFGVEEFNRRCRESVRRYVNDFEALTERSAVWIDTRDTYWTLSNDYIESVWWLVRQLYDKGLLYEGHRVVPYCPRCGTALSSHELGQPGAYRDVTELSIYVRFPVVGADYDLLVWTTTPWTLISNVAAAVGPDIEYVRVSSADPGLGGPTSAGGRDLVMAAALAPEGAEVTERWLGSQLVGWRYQRPFEFLPVDDRAQRVVAGSFVTTDEGTGIVHLAPAFGVDDMEVGKAEDLPMLNPVGADGAFDASVPPWQGVQVKAADRGIIEDLASRGVLVREEAYTHAYPHCWRCGTPLIYWAKNSWFVRTSERKADLLRENETINWHPEHIKHGRFGDWLQNNIDWALSRDRFWGTPLPIWRCANGHDTCIGSVAELSELAGLRGPNAEQSRDLTDLDLHRPYVDGVELACPAAGCGERAHRLPPVLDAWFDSGSMPSAQHHYPFGEAADFEEHFPADFICEAIDQTRGWFYSLLAVNTLVFDSTPYRNVVCLALVVDEFGQKMSKSKGNVIDPWTIFESFGADALRWYFFSAGSPWTSRRVYEDGIREATRKTLLTLWNVFAFFATYADIEGWEPPADDALPQASHVLDRWVLSALDGTVVEVTERLEAFDALAASAALASFVDDLSNWYVRRSRPRFWGASGAAGASGQAGGDPVALVTLHQCLVVTSQLLAPFCPFLADELFTRLSPLPSVHLSDWPEPTAAADAGLAAEMAAARRLVGLGRAARTDATVRLRQPLRRALLLHPGTELSEEVRREIASELNVKALEDVVSLEELMTWTVVPNFRALGPRLGHKVNAVKQALAEADGAALRRQLESEGFVEVAGERLEPGDVEIRAGGHEEFALAQEGGWAVALDLELDDDLRNEGVARELVRELNDLRKRLDLALTDRIAVRIAAGPRVSAAMDAHRT